ncbi:MAG TPA: hypothetical protein VGE07_31015 [Herpetosiphonaceae bacterium]
MYQAPLNAPPPSPGSIWLGALVAAAMGLTGMCLCLGLPLRNTSSIVWWGGSLVGAELAAWVTLRRRARRGHAATESLLFWGVLSLAAAWLLGTISLFVYAVMTIG